MPYQDHQPFRSAALNSRVSAIRAQALSTCFQMFHNKTPPTRFQQRRPIPLSVFRFPAIDRILQASQSRCAWPLLTFIFDEALHHGPVTASPYGGLRSRSSNRAASLNAPAISNGNSSAGCGSPRNFRITDSTASANLLFGRNLGRSSSVSFGSSKYTPHLGHFNRS